MRRQYIQPTIINRYIPRPCVLVGSDSLFLTNENADDSKAAKRGDASLFESWDKDDANADGEDSAE